MKLLLVLLLWCRPSRTVTFMWVSAAANDENDVVEDVDDDEDDDDDDDEEDGGMPSSKGKG